MFEKVIEEYEKKLLESRNNFTTIQEIEMFTRTIIKLRALRQILRLLGDLDDMIIQIESFIPSISEVEDIADINKQITSLLRVLKDIVQDKPQDKPAILFANNTENKIIDINVDRGSLEKIKPLLDRVMAEWELYEE